MRSDLQRMHPWNAAVQVLNEAIDAGLVNNTIGQIDYPGLITPSAIEHCERIFEQTGTANTADLENAGASPKSIRFRSMSRGRQVHPSTSAPFAAWTVELARFIVPFGKVGVVKGFEQYLAQEADDPNPAFVYTQNSRWGIPGPWHTGLTNEITDAGKWHFRLKVISRTAPSWWNLLGAGTLPDLPYTDFAHETGLWWPAGSDASQNTHMIIPGGHMLRVFFETPAQSVRLEAAAKLRGWVQSDRTPETSYNVRTNY